MENQNIQDTEREELQQSKSRLSRGESVSKSGNWEFHPETGHFIVSEGSASVFGIDKRRIDFPDIQQIILPEYHSDLKNSLDLLIRKEDPFDVEFKIRKSNSGEILDIHSIAEFDKKEKTVFGVIQDITVQKHAQEKLKRQSQNLSFLLEIGQTFASTLNMDILLQAIVERAVRLLNLDSGAIYLVSDNELFLAATTPPLPMISAIFSDVQLSTIIPISGRHCLPVNLWQLKMPVVLC